MILKKEKITEKVKKIVAGYDDKKFELYEDFALAIKTIIEKLIENNDLKSKVQIVAYRAKDRDKLEEKLKRPDRKDEQPYFIRKKIKNYSDVDDLAGVRVIFYLESDAQRFSILAEKEFKDAKIDKDIKNKYRGYKAIHLNIKNLDKKRLQLTEYSKFKGLQCEIQITTPVMHAWSELEHEIVYKPREEIKKRNPRSIELLDGMFKNVMEKHIEIVSFEFENIAFWYKEVKKNRDIFNAIVLVSDDNNKIYDQLLILEKYASYFRINKYGDEKISDLLKKCLEKTRENKIKNEYSIFGEIPGKKVGDIIYKILDIIDDVKTYDFKEAFSVLVEIYESKGVELEDKKVLEIIENFAKYKVIRKEKNRIVFRYQFQRDILDMILGWETPRQIKNIRIISKVLSEILKFSYEFSEMQDWNKVSFISGPLVLNDYLKKIRRNAINLAINLFKEIEDIKEKIKLLDVLENTSRTHSSIDEKGRKFVAEDLNYIVRFYEKIIFDKKEVIIAEAPIVLEIEKQLIWMLKRDSFIEEDKINDILKKIREDEFYGLYRILIGDITFHEEGGYEAWQKKKDEIIANSLKKINADSIKKWIETLNNIAKYKNVTEGWTQQWFSNLLQRISEEKPEIAEIILDNAFENKKPLVDFSNYFLSGFRRKNNVELWDKYVAKIIENKSTDLFSGALVSYLYIDPKNIKKEIRESDVDLFKKAISGKDKHEFLRAKGINESMLHSALFSGLLQIYEKNPVVIEELIIKEIKINRRWISLYVRELDFMNNKKMAHISNWSSKFKKYILEKLAELNDLDYSAQNVLFGIGKKDFNLMMEFFLKRIKKAQKERPQKRFEIERYNAIPYHFNEDLKKYISEDQKERYLEYVSKWSKKMTKNWSVYNWELGEFIEKMKLSFTDVLKNIINRGDKKSLNNAIDILRTVSIPPLEICFEIIKKTSDKEILNRVESIMYATGTVMGEHGFSEAHKEKAKLLEKYVNDSNKNVKEFALKMIKQLNKRAEEERKREDEEIQLRKIEFEN